MKIGLRCGEHLLEDITAEPKYGRAWKWETNKCDECGDSCGISCEHEFCVFQWVNDPYCKISYDIKGCTF